MKFKPENKGDYTMRKITVLSICVVLVFSLSFASSTMASDEDDVLKVATNFTKAFSTLDYDLMASLHSESTEISKFTPSASGAFLTQGWETISKDWKSTFDVPAGTYVATSHNQQATMLGNGLAVTTQYMILVVTDPTTGVQTTNLMRQTLVLQKIGGKWLIVHEHASILPTE
jgi:ketosteroid isomerase-like protein